LIGIWFAQNRVQGRYYRHVYVAQKSQKMAPGRPAVDAKLVLDQNYLNVVDIEEIGGAAIGIEFFFVDLKSDPSGIVVAFGSIIDRAYDALTFREFRRNCITNVRGERGNAALTWKVISQKSYLLDVGDSLHPSVYDFETRRFSEAACSGCKVLFTVHAEKQKNQTELEAGQC
jgi:hypothetical protein